VAHAFTYGSLMWADIMARVCGLASQALPASLPARLADHARHPVQGQEYPGLQPAPGAEVAGRLYLDVPESAWARLDAFEGPEYERVSVAVRLEDGRQLDAFVYRFRPEFHTRLASGDWDEAAFARAGKARFEARYLGFAQIAEGPAA
jgi:gamma-glutamylcyclotransferase (GGCT)/AIG2-like uncharacterized protein YtfP